MRLAKAALNRASGAEWAYNYERNAKDLVGTVLHDPTLRQPAPQTGSYAAYRRERFGRIISRYKGSGTSIIFLRLPRGPVAPSVNHTPGEEAKFAELDAVRTDDPKLKVLEADLIRIAARINQCAEEYRRYGLARTRY